MAQKKRKFDERFLLSFDPDEYQRRHFPYAGSVASAAAYLELKREELRQILRKGARKVWEQKERAEAEEFNAIQRARARQARVLLRGAPKTGSDFMQTVRDELVARQQPHLAELRISDYDWERAVAERRMYAEQAEYSLTRAKRETRAWNGLRREVRKQWPALAEVMWPKKREKK